MSSSSPVPAPLEYAPRASDRPARGFRVAFWAATAYCAILAALLALYAVQLRQIRMFLLFLPTYDAFRRLFLIDLALPAVFAIANVLPAIAYFRAARGRAPRGLIVAYCLIQSILMTTHFLIVCYLFARSPHDYQVAPGRYASIGVPGSALVRTLILNAFLTLPMLALLIPRVRRACLARG
ncbi:MAG TPA: hypothetical protein VH475_16885 [Tepidisphaeraceae bacterium]